MGEFVAALEPDCLLLMGVVCGAINGVGDYVFDFHGGRVVVWWVGD